MHSTMMDNFQMGRVVSRTFGALAANAVTFLILAAVLTVPLLGLAFYFAPQMAALTAATATTPGTPPNPAAALAIVGQTMRMSLASFFIAIVFSYILQAALVQGTITYLNGGKANLGNCLATGFKYFLPLIGLAILGYLGMMVGFVLLIVPGIILGLMWSVIVPVFVVEHPGVMASFGRSSALTKGHRWQIFWLVLLYVVIVWIINLVVGLAMGVSLMRAGPGSFAAPYLMVSWLVRVPLTALAAVGIAAIYYELRLVKEGVGPQQLAAAFD